MDKLRAETTKINNKQQQIGMDNQKTECSTIPAPETQEKLKKDIPSWTLLGEEHCPIDLEIIKLDLQNESPKKRKRDPPSNAKNDDLSIRRIKPFRKEIANM